MARPTKCRRICALPKTEGFIPTGARGRGRGETVLLQLDEYEVIRLIDLESLTQEECARQMGIARTTVTGIYDSARKKLADALVCEKRLIVGGGEFALCENRTTECGTHDCCHKACHGTPKNKGEHDMKIAVTYDNGMVFQHFGHSEQFKLYEIENGELASATVVSTMGSGHGALAAFLQEQGVDTLICGGIGGGAKTALEAAGIKLYGGVVGGADGAVKALLAGKLDFNPAVECSHHNQEHGDDAHTCGEHGCGRHE
ncbi:MAG: DUF134 domain-containing protein [Pygmaiobacter sp.]